MTRAWRIVSALAVLAAAAPVAAQQPQPPAGPPEPPAELVFEREVFSYPSYERRNPFAPLTNALAGGPRFEQIRLRGIIWSDEPGQSLALFGTGDAAAPPAEAGAGGPLTRRLRVGEAWGNVRVLEIHRDRVVVEVEEFGLMERRVMELTRRRSQGGS